MKVTPLQMHRLHETRRQAATVAREVTEVRVLQC